MHVRDGTLVCTLIWTIICSCLPVEPPLPQLLVKPVLHTDGLTVVADAVDGYIEAVHLSWNSEDFKDIPLASYTIIRKLPSDSIFDVFAGSRMIPADTADFFDPLINYQFPVGGFDSICYRIFGVDSFSRPGDTSDIVALIVAPQPDLQPFDDTTYCFNWESWIRGGVTSWCTVWHETENRRWSSVRIEAFPFTDEPALFNACFPDSLRPPLPGRWYGVFYLKSNDALSIGIGRVDVR